MASGVRTVEISRASSRFVSAAHAARRSSSTGRIADVSGRHFEIISLDESGAQIVVHGDNGVTVNGTLARTGFMNSGRKPGETLLLGGRRRAGVPVHADADPRRMIPRAMLRKVQDARMNVAKAGGRRSPKRESVYASDTSASVREAVLRGSIRARYGRRVFMRKVPRRE